MFGLLNKIKANESHIILLSRSNKIFFGVYRQNVAGSIGLLLSLKMLLLKISCVVKTRIMPMCVAPSTAISDSTQSNWAHCLAHDKYLFHEVSENGFIYPRICLFTCIIHDFREERQPVPLLDAILAPTETDLPRSGARPWTSFYWLYALYNCYAHGLYIAA